MWSSLFSPLYSWVAHICGLFFSLGFGVLVSGHVFCFLGEHTMDSPLNREMKGSLENMKPDIRKPQWIRKSHC